MKIVTLWTVTERAFIGRVVDHKTALFMVIMEPGSMMTKNSVVLGRRWFIKNPMRDQ